MKCWNKKRKPKHWTKPRYKITKVIDGKRGITQTTVYMKSIKGFDKDYIGITISNKAVVTLIDEIKEVERKVYFLLNKEGFLVPVQKISKLHFDTEEVTVNVNKDRKKSLEFQRRIWENNRNY